MKKFKIGYTQGAFDLFHVGHLNLLRRAKEQCEYLIVGVNSDRLVEEYKHKKPINSENERREIVGAIRYVDKCVVADTLDKVTAWKNSPFDAIFIGSDWKGNERWLATEKALAPYGAEVVYLEHTDGVSASILREKLFEEDK